MKTGSRYMTSRRPHKKQRCFICNKIINTTAWEFQEGTAHPECALTSTKTNAALKGEPIEQTQSQ